MSTTESGHHMRAASIQILLSRYPLALVSYSNINLHQHQFKQSFTQPQHIPFDISSTRSTWFNSSAQSTAPNASAGTTGSSLLLWE